MKRIILLLFVFTLITNVNAQRKVELDDVAYRRSSLHTMLMDFGTFMHKDLVIGFYNQAPFPDKYNDHSLEAKIFNPMDYALSKEAIELMKSAGDTTNLSDAKEKVKKVEAELPYIIANYFNQTKAANQMVAKWFNRQPDGTFDMSLIHERGSYDASAMEAEIAKGSIRGLASLKDAGEELLKNTFIVVNGMNFIENEPYARAVRDVALAAADHISNELARAAAKAAANVTYNATKDGYSVFTTSYLFQLDWNEEVANDFYMNYWVYSDNIDSTRVAAFDTTTIFKLNYVGYQKAKSVVLISAGKEFNDIIQLATIRNIDKGYTKLQKEYDVFKTKTPIINNDPIEAKIGMKEGLEGGEKFDVLEQVWDKHTQTTIYKKVGQVKVDKKNIWDNRYNMGEGDIENPEISATQFKGAKVEPGMLLRQVK